MRAWHSTPVTRYSYKELACSRIQNRNLSRGLAPIDNRQQHGGYFLHWGRPTPRPPASDAGKSVRNERFEMKRWLSVMAGLAMWLGLGAGILQGAEVQFSAGITISSRADFYDPLAAYGTWVDVGTYGRCWHPARVEVGWRPYCE